jgi:mRNA interferase RelE/StbE
MWARRKPCPSYPQAASSRKPPPASRRRARSAADPLAPNNNVKKLRGVEGYRLRIGDWRVVYTLERGTLTVVVVKVGHRGSVYE